MIAAILIEFIGYWAERTHPLEFLGLNLGSAVILPFRSGIYGWLFTTAQWHTVHHSRIHSDSNTNFGCSIILWDRIFGTFSGKTEIEEVGNGTGARLSLWTQLALPFYSNEKIRNL